MKNEILYNDPWPHVLIENCIEQDIFDQLKISCSLLFANVSDGNYTFDIYDLLQKGFPSNLIRYLIDYTEYNILDNYENILNKFSNHRLFKNGVVCIPQIGVSKNSRHGIHDDTDSNYKLLTYLIYISPEKSIGTELYKTKLDDSLFSTVSWKPNSGVYFCPYPSVTYHDFVSNNDIRITLNLNLSSVDFLLNGNTRDNFFKMIDRDRIKWLLDIFINKKLHRSKIDLVRILKEEFDKK